jgi:hypothetical protein
VEPQVDVDARQDETRGKRRQKEPENVHCVTSYCVFASARAISVKSCSKSTT